MLHRIRLTRLLPRHRCQVSLASVLQQSTNVLPCYNIVKQQLAPEVQETPGLCAETRSFTHSITWSWNGRELREEGTYRTKRGAKNEAARNLLKQLAALEDSALDPRSNGAVAQWLIGSITENLEATVEVNEERGEEQGESNHTCTFSCPQIQGELVATGSARAANESRRQAFAALYGMLPPHLEEVYMGKAPSASSQSGEEREKRMQSKAKKNRLRMGELNAMHNQVVQKLNIQARHDFQTTAEGIECQLTWRFHEAGSGLQTVEVVATAASKAAAKAMANEQMLLQQGQIPQITEEVRASIEEIRWDLQEMRVQEACQKSMGLMETAHMSAWSFFLPSVLRAVLGEGDRSLMHDLLDTTLRLQERGLPVDLWESLLDEASFAIRHYFMALPALRQLAGFPLADNFPGEEEKAYFRQFRHLLALERHGGLMSGIQTYELDPQVACSVPTVEVHLVEGDRVALTSPEGGIELIEGARPLRATDLVLLVPTEAAEDVQVEEEEMGNKTAWQHPEAWLASVTSVTGNRGEEVRVNLRRISDFGSDVELQEGGQRVSPITIGREFRLYFLAMETPMSRQLAALRCLTAVKLPAWSENFEGRPSYQYQDFVKRLLVCPPEDVAQLAQAPARGGLTRELAAENLEKLKQRHSLIATLTESQSGAVLNALEQRLSLVQGPPGTGKTHVACAILAAWSSLFAPLGDRILAVADSNVAADNIYVRLQKMGLECARVGQGKEVETLHGQQMWDEVQRAKIVVATCIGSGMDILARTKTGGGFQRVLVDECTQACEPAVLVPLGRQCEQVVLIGDHRQLPATVLSKVAQHEGLGLSLFERMATINHVEPSVLLEQRRMHSSIADFPNQIFYAGQLINASDDALLPAVPGFPWPNPDCRVAFVDVSKSTGHEGRRGFSAFNTAEAEAVATTLESIISAGYPPGQIVVLTAYLAQKQEILRALRERGLGGYLNACHVDTIDGYQGMEQGLVLFSATRNNDANALGFLADNRRMNVMLTRAKQGLIVFGNAETLQRSESVESKWPQWLEWVEQRNAGMTADDLLARQQQMERRPEYQEHPREPFPDIEEDLPQPLGIQGGAPSPPRPSWQQVYSAEYKAFYYWNKETNLTQWEAPPTFAPAPEAS